MAHPADTTRPNALAGERSPFLKHGASQPVDWLPWGESAFELARERNMPLLLDIGAVWCHWCHVMDRESYEDPGTAALINELFVPVKVDRDERPDVDARYQRAVQVLTGQGGWPLTAFLTPEGDVYYGGTYFPPDERFGRPSFQRVLREVARVWSEEPQRATEAARGIRERLADYSRAEAARGAPSSSLIADTLEELANTFDFRYGGFGRAPKFPNAGAIDLLIDHWLDTGTDWAKRAAFETLHAMARGGIHDQIGGGFHRYATDARWIIPHFEKMSYDNGVLLQTYARAHGAAGDVTCADVARNIVRLYENVTPDLVAVGGFPASQDADLGPDDDGDYWTWTVEELEAALDEPGLARAARLFYGLDDPAGSMHLDPSRHVLFQSMDIGGLAVRTDTDAATAAATIERARAVLEAVRDRRPRPYVDETLYAGWVALLASGHLAAARHLRHRDAGQAALRAMDRIWKEAFDGERGIAHRLGDEAADYYLDDQTFVAAALVDAFEWSQEPEHLERAQALVGIVLDRFRDPVTGAFLDRPREAPAAARPLEQPFLPIADAPTPSGNAVAALTLFRISALTHEDALHRVALDVLAAFGASVSRLTSAAATYMKALAWGTLPVTTVVVVDENQPRESELLDTALAAYRPRTVVRHFTPGAVDPGSLPESLRAMVGADSPHAYVCAGTVCAAPVSDPRALRDLLREFHA